VLIILHSPQFTHEDRVDGTLSGRHTVSLTTSSGVITLDRNDCRRILPAVMHLARFSPPLVDDDGEVT
jgi:hypothetical protein